MNVHRLLGKKSKESEDTGFFEFPKMIHASKLISCQGIPHRRSEKFKDIKAAISTTHVIPPPFPT